MLMRSKGYYKDIKRISYGYGWKGALLQLVGRASHLSFGGKGTLLPLVGMALHCHLVGSIPLAYYLFAIL